MSHNGPVKIGDIHACASETLGRIQWISRSIVSLSQRVCLRLSIFFLILVLKKRGDSLSGKQVSFSPASVFVSLSPVSFPYIPTWSLTHNRFTSISPLSIRIFITNRSSEFGLYNTCKYCLGSLKIENLPYFKLHNSSTLMITISSA